MSHASTNNDFAFFVMADSAAKFFNSLYISGWSLTRHDPLVEIHVVGTTRETSIVSIQDSHPSIEGAQSFQVQVLFNFDFSHDIEVVFKTLSGLVVHHTVGDLINQRASHYPSKTAFEVFRAKVNAMPNARILDIGGRDRSQRTYKESFPNAEYVVVDIVDGENVDVVADAHNLSSVFENSSFDFVFSTYVFEHLLMPWKVALEINKILRVGGSLWIQSHQTLGLHDFPWDYWRFSSDSWASLFNQNTGFEIVETISDHEMYIIPSLARKEMFDSEKTAGHEVSAVHAVKVGDTELNWDTPLTDLVTTKYPG
jgi:SAM-dependent methyltransferase